jgi:large subunit ribosomal protein L9
MELILLKDVEKLGRRGAVVKVARGYARNYLLPRGLAAPATAAARAAVAHQVEREGVKNERFREQAEAVASRLANVALNFEKRANESGELYGSVTAGEVAEALAARGFEFDKKQVSFDQPVTHVGLYAARLRLFEDVEASVPITVVELKE